MSHGKMSNKTKPTRAKSAKRARETRERSLAFKPQRDQTGGGTHPS